MPRFLSVISAALLVTAMAGGAQAATYSFSTADSPFNPGEFNQGWWDSSDAANPNPIGSSNVFTGRFLPDDVHRSYFTFDLSSLSLAANEVIASVTFGGNVGNINVSGGDVETLGLFDVTTSAAVLNEQFGATAGVFADLGGGNLYAARNFADVDDNTDFIIDLNPAAIADILAAQGDFFSIGGALLSLDGQDPESIFGTTGGNPFSLNIETRISAVPLPAAFPLYGAGLAVLGFLGWRKRRKAAL